MELTSPQKHKFLRWFWSLFIAFIGILVLVFWAISKGWIGYMPPLEELQNPKNKFATEIYSSDMQLIGTYFTAKDNRLTLSYDEISPNVINALIATEDERFMKHSGIDGHALARVLFKRIILLKKSAGGGSTITQQLAKLLYSPVSENVFQRAMRKPVEWVIAAKLERLYSKEEILTMYLNKFDFLNNAVGIKTASEVYFGIQPKDLRIEQAALLVGMCQNPSVYNPASKRRRPKALLRRNVVLKQMEKNHYITKIQYDSLRALPLELDFHRVDHKLGTAPYFREYLRLMLTAKKPKRSQYADWQLKPRGQYYLDSLAWQTNPLYGFLEKNRKPDGSKYDLYRDGLKIYTTIDTHMQTYAEDAVEKNFKVMQETFNKTQKNNKKAPYASYVSDAEIKTLLNRAKVQSDRYRLMKRNGATDNQIDKAFNTPTEMMVFSWDGMVDTVMTPMDSIRYYKYFARCGMMSMDPQTGYVKAYVGGPDFSYFQYDMVNMGRRQIGSTIKPFLYTLAMSEGYSPCTKTVNEPITLYDKLGRPFTPRNESNNLKGDSVTFLWGLQHSNNWVAAYVMSLFTPEQLTSLMRSFGIKGPIDPVVSLALGPCEVSVSEMVDAYTVFPNNGIRIAPIYVTHIDDNMGNRIADFVPRTEEVIDTLTAYKMVKMLQAVINGGTGVRVRYRYHITAPLGGKTGTTQKNSDGWFIGFTPNLVTGVWVGWEDRDIHFRSMALGQGASTALPVWATYMQDVFADSTLGYSQNTNFNIPQTFSSNFGCH